MWHVFLDESGHPNDATSDVFAIAGFMATQDSWAKLTKDWNSVLRAQHIQFLHMREFAHSVGQFSSWKGDETRRRRFVESILTVIEHSGAYPIVSALIMDAYRSLREAARARLGGPYLLLLQCCIVDSASRLETSPLEERVAYCVERQDEFASAARQAFKKLTDPGYPMKCRGRLAGFDVGDKSTSAPLQAADLMAFEAAKYVRYRMGYDVKQREMRFPLKRILHNSFREGKLFDRNGLQVLLAECGVSDPWGY